MKNTNFRHVATGSIVKLPINYAEPNHPFYSQYEMLGDNYEYSKAYVETEPDEVEFAVVEEIIADFAVVERPAGNASRELWVEYAETLDLDITDDMTRSDIIALIDKEN